MKINIYNVKKLIETKNPDFVLRGCSKIAIIVGAKGVIVSDDDAVHEVVSSIDDSYKLQLNKRMNDTAFPLIASHYIDPPISVLLANAECETVELDNFIRHFGARIENNRKLLLQSINELGVSLS